MTDRATPGVRIRFIRDIDNLEESAFTSPLVQDRLISFEYQDETKKRSKVKLVFNNKDLALYEEDTGLLGGGIILLSYGYRDLLTTPRLIALKKAKGNDKTLTIEGYDIGILEDQIERCRLFENKRRSEIAEQIAEEQGFARGSIFVDDTAEVIEGISQAGWTDAEFLRRLADKEGYEYYVDTKGFHFKEQRNNQAPIRVIGWYEGPGTILSWSSDVNMIRRVGGSSSKSHDPETKEESEFRANSDTVDGDTLAPVDQVAAPEHVTAKILELSTIVTLESGAELDPNEYGVPLETILAEAEANPSAEILRIEQEIGGVTVTRLVQITRSDSAAALSGEAGDPTLLGNNTTSTVHAENPGSAQQNARRAKARYKRASRNAVKLKVNILGDPEILAGSVVRVNGIGPWLSGLYYVESHMHKISSSGYRGVLKLTADGVNKVLGIYVPKGQGSNQNEQDPAIGAEVSETGVAVERELEPFDDFDFESGEIVTFWK